MLKLLTFFAYLLSLYSHEDYAKKTIVLTANLRSE